MCGVRVSVCGVSVCARCVVCVCARVCVCVVVRCEVCGVCVVWYMCVCMVCVGVWDHSRRASLMSNHLCIYLSISIYLCVCGGLKWGLKGGLRGWL